MEAQDGEEAEEEEEERGRFGDEADVMVGSSFSIMVVMSLFGVPVGTKLLFLSAAQRVCVTVSCPSVLFIRQLTCHVYHQQIVLQSPFKRLLTKCMCLFH